MTADKQNYFTYTDNTSDSNDKTMENLHKRIIIDDVPVQDCCYFDYENDGYEDSCYMYDNECSANCNCYYKQLKAKEQELEQYKRSKQASYEAIQAKCNELELENRELKAVHSCNVALSDELFKYKAENKRLKQTLTEIKEIAEGCQYGDCHECKYKQRTDCRTELIAQILQKISEVISDEN